MLLKPTSTSAALGRSVSIGLRRAGERWVAQVEGAGLAAGMDARPALLWPLPSNPWAAPP